MFKLQEKISLLFSKNCCLCYGGWYVFLSPEVSHEEIAKSKWSSQAQMAGAS